MSESNRIVYGIHSATFYNRASGEQYGPSIEVVGSVALALSGESNQLIGGSQKYPVASEDGAISSEITIAPKVFPDFLYQLFLGKLPTKLVASATGATSALSNKTGVSVFNATTGITTATAISGSESDMKFGKYVIKAVTATTVDVFTYSNVDFTRGTDKTYEDTDSGKITATPLTITTGAPVTVPGYGIELTGGSGVIALVTDDTAIFEVTPPYTESSEVVIGGVSDTLPEFGMIAYGQKRGDGSLYEIDIFRAKGIGLPQNLTEKAYMESEIKAVALFDTGLQGIFKMRDIKE